MTSDKVIRTYLIIAGLYTLSASLIWGVNTLFLLEAGLDIFAVFIANSVFTAAMAVFEIPTGVLADTAGRRASFLLSVVVLALGTLGYVAVSWWGGLLGFALMSIVLGLGYTFYSGAVEAWLVDALNATDFKGELDSVFSRGGMVTSGAMLVGTVSGGFLGDIDLAFPFIGRAVLLLILFIIAWFLMHDLGYERRTLHPNHIPQEMNRIFRASLDYGWNQRGLRLLMGVGLLYGSFFSWAWYAWQPYFLELLGMNAVWVSGVIAALLAFSMIVGNGLVERLKHLTNRRTTLLIGAALVFSVCSVGVGLAGEFYLAVGLFLVAAISYGVTQPVRQAYMHRSIPSSERATIVSLDSMVSSSGSIVGQSGLGYLSQMVGYAPGYLVGGLITLLILPILALLRKRGEAVDFFDGGKAGQDAACAAQGLPDVAGVDTRSAHLSE
jgi:MFS family permease